MVSIVLMTLPPFTAGAQEQESEVNTGMLAETLASCSYEWECFDIFDFQKKTALFHLEGVKCPDGKYGVGFLTLDVPKGLKLSGSFNIRGLGLVWWFGKGDLKYSDYKFIVHLDGSGLFYDFSNGKEGESILPSEVFTCVDRTDAAGDRLWEHLETEKRKNEKAHSH